MSVQTPFTIDKFDRSVSNWERWLQRLEGAFTVFDVKNDKKVHFLLHFMGQASFDIVCDKFAPNSAYTKTYEEICNVLKLHYDPKPLEIMENFRFYKCQQRENENVQDYVSSLRRLAVNCNFGAYLDTALRNQLVFGLRSEGIQSRLLEIKDLTLEKAIETASALELSSRNAAQLHQKGNSLQNMNYLIKNKTKCDSRDKVKKTVETKNNSSDSSGKMIVKVNKNNLKCFRCGSLHHLANKCKYKSAICNFCHIKGHLKAVCSKAKSNVNQIEVNSDEIKINELQIFNLQNNSEKIWLKLIVNGHSMKFELDTGSPVSLINSNVKSLLFGNFDLHPPDIGLITYCGTKLNVLGYFMAEVKLKDNDDWNKLKLYVVEGNNHALLGREWMSALKIDWNAIVNRTNTVSQIDSVDERVKLLVNKFSRVFSGEVGKIEGIQAKLHLKDDCQPVFCKPRIMPFAIQKKVEVELDSLVESGILKKIDTSDWATPIVPVLKSNGTVRICGDYKITLNPNLKIDEHPLPTVDQLFSNLAGGQKFTKIDLAKAYLQMPVRDEDQELLVLNTHKGLYKPTRLMYGIASAPAIWQRQIEMILQGIEGVTTFLDDIKITGPTDEIHLKRLEMVAERLSKYNMTVNLKKCSFFANQIEYCGYLIDANGIHKLPAKVEAIQKMPRPENVDQVRSFIGLVNYYGRFVENMSTIIMPLNNLLRKDSKFVWDIKSEEAFIKIKTQMQSTKFLVHYNPQYPLILATDASSYGVGAVLSHIYPDGTERPIQYASQTLSETQRKYTQIDKEAYAIIFGVKRFIQYLLGNKFTLLVDNKPLVQILSSKKGLPPFTAMRMQHYELFLRSFDYVVKYKNTKDHGNADAMSRLPLKDCESSNCFDESDIVEINFIETLPITTVELKEATMKDLAVKSLIQGLRTGRIVDKDLRFGCDQKEFTLQNDCLMRGIRAYIPSILRDRVLAELHSSHFGMTRMKSLARSYCWWSGIDGDIELLVKDCSSCQVQQANPRKASIHVWEPSSKVFERVHVDFAGPFMGVYFFILVDSFSKWPEVHMIKNITSSVTIEICRRIFSCFGLPSVIVSDRGTQFTSNEFREFLSKNGIVYKVGAPYHPATNGQAERYVRTIKEKLKTLNCHPNDINAELSRILMDYRRTIHPSTGKSPAMMMFNREIRTRLDLLIPTSYARQNQVDSALKRRELKLNAKIIARDYLSKNTKWRFGKVIAVLGPLNYEIELEDGRRWQRHIDQIREIGPNATDLKNKIPFTSFIGDYHQNDDSTTTLPVNDQLPIESPNTANESRERDKTRRPSIGGRSSTEKEVQPVQRSGATNPDVSASVESTSVTMSPELRRSTRARRPVQKLNI